MHSLPRLRCFNLLRNKPISIHRVKQIHAQLITNGFKFPSLYAQLIDRYCAIYSPLSTNQAHLVLQHYGEPNLFLLNTLLRCAPPKESTLIFATRASMGDLSFNDFTYIFVLGACARTPSIPTLLLGNQVHAQILKHGVMSNIRVKTTVIHFYARNKDIHQARKMFDEIPERNSVTWNAMIAGYCSQRDRENEYSINALVLFHDMLVDVSGVRPTVTTMVCILTAASQLGVLEIGASIHAYIQKTIDATDLDVFIGTGLVDMYSKCGCLDSALSSFKQMNQRNVLTWTAMATGLAVHGRGKETLSLLDAMWDNGVKPNVVTFTSLLSGCCHSGLVEGLQLFHEMESKFGVKPHMEHYGCIVNLLGRAGHLEEAYDFIMAMPICPDMILWRSLLSASNVHGDIAMGEKVAKLLIHLQPEKSSRDSSFESEDYVALSNIYASVERWEDVEMVREEMKAKGVENKAGSSSIQISRQLWDVV